MRMITEEETMYGNELVKSLIEKVYQLITLFQRLEEEPVRPHAR
jgi:hypothetical protein